MTIPDRLAYALMLLTCGLGVFALTLYAFHVLENCR